MKKKNGQTLIEAVVALGVIVVILSAIAVAVLSSLNNAQYSQNQNLATQYAQQGMEVVRQISQSDWTTFSSRDTSYCLDQNGNLTPKGVNCPQNVNVGSTPFFVREVDIFHAADLARSSDCNPNTPTPPGVGAPAQASLVKVIVSWSDGGCTSAGNLFCRNVQLVSCMTNAR